MRRAGLLALAAALLVATAALAHEAKLGAITLLERSVKPSLAGAPNSAGFLTIVNAGAAPDRLMNVSCACAARVEIHEMTMTGGVMRMRRINGGLPVPARARVELKPGGKHLMLLGLKGPLKQGAHVNLTLRFQHAGQLTTDFHVEAKPGGMKH